MKPFVNIVVLVAAGLCVLYVYNNYGREIKEAIFGDTDTYNIFVDSVALTVTLADTVEERKQGLSGTPPLGPLEGKLFLFDTADEYGIWMKDMNYPIDIFWINEKLEIVHIVSSASPDSYPKTIFYPELPARYVLETSALFADTYKVEVGERITLPPALIPSDLKQERLDTLAE